MDTTSNPNLACLESRRIEQLSLPLLDAEPDEENSEIVNEIADVSIEVQQRIEVIQQVMAVRGTERYAKVQRQAAKKLGLSVRSLQHLCRVSHYFSFRLALFFVLKATEPLLSIGLSNE